MVDDKRDKVQLGFVRSGTSSNDTKYRNPYPTVSFDGLAKRNHTKNDGSLRRFAFSFILESQPEQ